MKRKLEKYDGVSFTQVRGLNMLDCLLCITKNTVMKIKMNIAGEKMIDKACNKKDGSPEPTNGSGNETQYHSRSAQIKPQENGMENPCILHCYK